MGRFLLVYLCCLIINEIVTSDEKEIDYVHSKDVHFAISIWQSFGPQTKPYRQLKEKNLLFDFETWPSSGAPGWPPRKDYPSGDLYSTAERDWSKLALHVYPERKGGFAGALQQRQFTVVMPDGTQKTIDYRGKMLKVKL